MTISNLALLHREQTERLGPRPALRSKRHGLYHDLSWDGYRADSLACAAALVDGGVQPGDRVGVLCENRLEWLVADMGILAAAAINVPAHAPLTSDQVSYQFEHAEIRWLFVSTLDQFEKVRSLRERVPSLKDVVAIEGPLAGKAAPWAGFLAHGRRVLDRHRDELERRCRQLGRDDLATIMYTSGTTGNPKGVMLSHGNLLSNAMSMVEGTAVSSESVILSWLPFSHIYGRLVDHYVQLAAGATLCLAESQETLIDNLREVEPTSFSAVPRFYEKVFAAVRSDTPEETGRRLRRVFGRRIQWLNSGGAPLPLAVAEAFRDAGLVMLQGYGLTESSPVITFNRLQSNRLGTVGQAVPDVEVRIAEDGELLTRGPHVMQGYWKNPAATAEAIRDGWLHTGDLGRLDADGFLTITGRKKDLLVLSNGKKVIPTDLEGRLLAEPCIDQAVVCGEGKSYLTALIVPNFDRLREAATAQGVVEPDNQRLVQDSRVYRLMERRVAAALAGVSPSEQVRKFILLPGAFTLEADELTVSLKVRRGAVMEKHRSALEALYGS